MNIATHNGAFHADDVLAVATLDMLGLVGSLVRTRDEVKLAESDLRLDVGGNYDPSKNDYDHHQIGGAGTRDNGLPYAAFGLIWKQYGAKLCGSQAVADEVDRNFVQTADAEDNGHKGYRLVDPDLKVYSFGTVVSRFNPRWNDNNSDAARDKKFWQAVKLAKKVLKNEIVYAKTSVIGEQKVRQAIAEAADRRLIILDKNYIWHDLVTSEAPEALYVVYPGDNPNDWRVQAVRISVGAYDTRKPLPLAWAGKRDADMEAVTGVKTARFCHTARFLAVAATREAALELARLALNS